jgi:AmmeMemoRadiSam system protein B
VVERVVLLGPAHFVPVHGIAASSARAFRTPLGDVPVDAEAVARALRLPGVARFDPAHAREHSLEVELPFLQRVLGPFALAPFAVGEASAHEVAALLEALWGGPETLIVISSDLSHYHDARTARRLDAATARAIESLDEAALGPESACGRVPLSGLLVVARRRGLRARRLDLRNSGDTAGGREEVVGYGAWTFGP